MWPPKWSEVSPEVEQALRQYAGALENLQRELAAHPRRGGFGLKISIALRVADSVQKKYPVDSDDA